MVTEKLDSTELMGRLSIPPIRRGAVHYLATLLRVSVPFMSFRLPATWVLVPVPILVPVKVYRC